MPASTEEDIFWIRLASADEEDVCSRIRRRAWEVAYPHIYSQEEIGDYFEGRTKESRTWPGNDDDGVVLETLVCIETSTSEICGYIKWGWTTSATPRKGELHSLYILPSHWSCGIGSRLWDHVVKKRAPEEQVRTLDIWVLKRARSGEFYTQRSGQGCCTVEKVDEGDYFIGDHRETALCYRWTAGLPLRIVSS